MVKTQDYTDKIYWLWFDDLDFVKRGDARYWCPENRFILNSKTRLNDLVEGIHEGRITPKPGQYLSSGIPFIRAQNVLKDRFDFSDRKFIDSALHSEIPKAHAKPNEVLLTIDGARLGSACVVPEGFPEGSISNHIVRIVPKKNISPYFISVFLNSKYGQQNIKQGITGSAQPGLRINAIQNFAIIQPSKKDSTLIENCVKESSILLSQAEEAYQQAQEILKKELGFDKVNLSDQRSFWRWSDEINVVQRLDPNYYQEKNIILQKLFNSKAYTVEPLSKLTTEIKKGVEVGHTEYKDQGIPFLRVANISKIGIDLTNSNFIRPLLFEELQSEFKANKGDILFTKDGTVGISLVFNEDFDCITSSGILRIKADEKKIDKYYLTLTLNSTIIKLQVLKETSGAIIQHFNIDKVKQLKIPLLPSSVQSKTASLVMLSCEKRRQSREQLEKAKKYVENLIEGNIR